MAQVKEKESWHVGKEIPIAMLFAIFAQTCGAIWWAATMSAKLDDLSYQVAALTADKYSRHDAEKDQALTFQKISDMERRMDECEKNRGYKWAR